MSMTPLQLKAANRAQLAFLRQNREKARDLLYLRDAGAKGVSVA